MFSTQRPTVAAAEEIIGKYFPVLDSGFVALVDYMGSDEDIERAARVSYGYGTRQKSDTRGLIRYLRRHKHTTPSEMVEFKFHCAMPIFVARQWIRHRTANVNEYSGRYSLMPMMFYTPAYDQVCPQSKSNRQGRSEETLAKETYQKIADEWNRTRSLVVAHYEQLTALDIAKELARIDLPLSMYTQWYWKIDLHNLLHFLTLRVDSHAQWEIQQYARVMAGMVKRVAPLSFEAWIDYEVCGAHWSRLELQVLNRILSGQTQAQALSTSGLSDREIREFQAKLQASQEAPPHFELSLSDAKTHTYFAELYTQAVPHAEQISVPSPLL